jgi:antitoxin (DNA-binding transcriptional repressor) of toxin-antitoxin stability system
VVVTKHRKPVAKLVPMAAKRQSLFGFAKGMLTLRGDIITPLEVDWEAAR